MPNRKAEDPVEAIGSKQSALRHGELLTHYVYVSGSERFEMNNIPGAEIETISEETVEIMGQKPKTILVLKVNNEYRVFEIVSAEKRPRKYYPDSSDLEQVWHLWAHPIVVFQS